MSRELFELTAKLAVGLLVAYQLARFGVEPYIVEKDDKTSAPIYGEVALLVVKMKMSF